MMPASRWQTSMAELLDWMGQADDELRMLVPPLPSSLLSKEEPAGEAEGGAAPQKYPDTLPILPLRGVVVYPQTAVPLTVGQAR
jgi:ATP-dependent Lon protease